MEPLISIRNLTKTYGEIKALDNISFGIKENSIFGLVGPDGAGKSTLIRILCGLMNPDCGEIEMMGKNILKDRTILKGNIGYLSQKFSLYTDLSVDENIEFVAGIHGVRHFKDRREELLKFTRLTKFRKFLAGKLSGGMKQKLALACTLIYRPKIVFLDEPTTGVDPVSRREFWVILSNMLREDITILISTPYMDEAERFNEIALIDNGRLIALGDPQTIVEGLKESLIEIICTPVRNAYSILKENLDAEIQLKGDRINILISKEKSGEYIRLIREILERSSVEIFSVRESEPSLENAFVHLVS